MKLKGKAKRQLMKVTALVMFAAVIVTNTAPLYAEGDENIPPSDEVVAEVSEDVTEGDNEEGAEDVPAPESSSEDSGESGGTPEEVQEPSQDQGAAPEAAEIPDSSSEVTEEPQITPEVIVDPAESPSSEPTAEPAAEPEPTAVPTVELEATAEPVAEPEATAVPDVTASPEAPEATPSEEPSVSPSAVPSVTPVVSPSASPSVSPSATPTASVSPTPSASPSVSPSATPTASPEKAEAVISSDGYSISGSGLKELTVTFDTADLNDGDSFNLVLSTSADSVSVIGNAFSAKESGRYKIEGLQKNALNITFGNLNEEEFTLTAEGTNVTFICNASDEPVETDEGYTGEASIKAVSEKEAEPEIKLVDKSIMTKTSDGAWVTVAGLLPEGATVTAVPVNVEIEGKVVLAAYDITILDAEGKEYKITETVTVSISAPALKEAEAEEVSVYHMEDENAEAEKVADVGIDYNKVSFGAEGFSIYIVVKDAEGNDVRYDLSDTFDLASFAKIEATVSANGSEISSEEKYAVNTTFRLDLKYTLDNTLINALKGAIGDDTEGTVEFVYHMPAEITSAKQAMKGEIRDLSKGVCGTYEIGEDGVVHFHFNKSFIKESSSISGTFEYYFSITDVTTITENKVEFQFPGTASKIAINVKVAEITGQKDVSNTGEKITFTIHLNNGEKACNNVVVTDTPGSNLQIDTGAVVVIKNGNAITEGFTIGAPDSNGVFTITFAHLDPNDKIEISYPASIKNPALDENRDGFVDGLGNKASWSVEGQGKGEDDATPWISTAKKGSKSGWVNGQSVSWEVNLNNGTIRNDVSGKEYTDTLTSVNQKYDQNSIKIYADGSEVTSSLKDSVVWNNDDDANPKSFSLTLPADAGTKAYKITYNTVPVTPINIGGSVEVSNEGSFGGESIGGDKETITRTEQVGVTKTHKESQTIASDGIVEWTSVITPDAGTSGLTNPEFKDFLGQTDWSSYYTWSGSVFLEDKLSISCNGSSLTEGIDYSVVYSKSSNTDAAVLDTMTIQFNRTYTNEITITYQSKDNGVGAESGNGKTINNACKVGNASATDFVWYKKEEGSTGHGIFKNGRVESDATGDYVWWTILANATKMSGGMPAHDFQGKTITVVDTLPDGVEYAEEYKYEGGFSDEAHGWAINFNGKKPQVSKDKKTLTFVIENVNYEAIGIKIKTKVTKYDEELTNHVSYNDGENELGTATGKVTVSSNLLQKSGEVIGDARTNIQYTIVVNEKEMDYRPDSDYLILEDTIPENVELVNGSVHFDVSEGTSYLYDANTRVLKIQVPDGRKVTVTYEVAPDLEGIKPDGSEYTVSVSNTVILSGSANIKSESKASYKVYEAGATAKGDRDKLTLQKIDAQTTDATLAGATYQLYSVSVPEGNPKFEAEQTTGNDGIISFGGLSFDQIYYYVETAAPSGYILDPVKYYFIYKDQEAAYNTAVNTFNQKFPGETLRTSPGGDFVKRTNVKKSVAEITAEKVLEGADIKDHTFQFTLTAVDNSGNALTGGNVYSETVKADETGKIAFSEIVYKSAGTYYYKIEEIRGKEPQITYDNNSYIITVDVSFNPLTDAMVAMVSYPENKPVVFVNTYQKTGSLKITKTLAGNDVVQDEYFKFDISLDDESINGTYSDVNFSKGKASITLKGGESKIIEGLPEGMGYTVTETAESSADYEVTSTGTTGTISAESIAEAAFTNTKNTYGDLTVTKTVAGNAADKEKEFAFIVTLSDNTITGTYGNMEFQDGVANFTLKHGQSMKAENLPTGVTYTVTEADYTSDGYTITTKTGETGTISKDCNLTAAFSNTRNTEGSLTVSKTLAGNDPDSSKDFTFTITLDDTTINETYSGVAFTNGKATITLRGGESKVIEGLPNGVGYAVTEADYSGEGYVTTVSGVAGESREASGTISENDAAVAAFTNTKDTYGNLTVTKTVAGNAADTDKEFSFTVTLSDKSISGTYGGMTFSNGVARFALKHGRSMKAENLPTGVTYTVTEEDYTSDGYKTTKTGETGTISKDCNLTAAFTNTRNTEGSLTVSKTLAGNDTDSSKDFTFTIKLDDTTINETYSDVTFTNGEATITLRGGESKVIEGLPNGVGYTVTEADYSGEGYVTTVSGVTGESREASGTISENAAAVAAFTNTKDTYGNLTVTKTVAGNAADTDKEFSFTVTLSDTSISGTYGGMTFSNGVARFTLRHGESMKAENLPTGVTYTVTEGDYTSDGYIPDKTEETGKISAGCDLTAAFTNTRNTEGSLTVSKTLAGNDTDSSKDFTFTIKLDDTTINETYSGVTFTKGEATITLRGGESKVIQGLPNGVGYTVTEADYSGEGYVTTVSGATGTNNQAGGTISEDTAAVAAFTNTRNTNGNLTVKKTVTGNAPDADKEFSFTVTLSDTSISGTYGGMTFSDGVAVFALKHGESKTAENLPTGVTYTVTEADYTAEEFVTTKSGETGIISEGCALEASFINTYTPASVSVSGKKTWDDNDNEYGKRPESITINLLADGKVVESKSVTKDDNWAWSFTDLPKYDKNGKEIVYTISEEKVKRYTADVSGFDVTNKYAPDEVEVKVTKVWEDNNDKAHIRPVKIMVQLYEDRLFDKEVEAPVELSADNNWTYTWKSLPRTKLFGEIDYAVKELGAVDEEGNIIDMSDLGYTCTVSEDTDNNIVITNQYTPREEPTPTPIVSPETTPTVSPSTTPIASPGTTPTATPGTTPTATPGTVPTATPDEMPTATPETTPESTPETTPETTPESTPETTPETTPESTPEATPETTPVSTPEATPESSPVPSETPEAPETPSDTPAPEEEPENPDNGPERTPDSRPDNTPAPTPVRQVLGANRLRIRASQGAVLGARRGIDCAVLGKRRRPGTGDNANIMLWVLMMSAAVGGAITSIIMLITGRRSKSR